MADNYNGQKDSTIVTTKDGSKLRKYRTPDGAIKYDKVKDDNDLFMQKLVESEKEVNPEKSDEEIDFDKNLYEMNIGLLFW